VVDEDEGEHDDGQRGQPPAQGADARTDRAR
jgi:hypothetical protein